MRPHQINPPIRAYASNFSPHKRKTFHILSFSQVFFATIKKQLPTICRRQYIGLLSDAVRTMIRKQNQTLEPTTWWEGMCWHLRKSLCSFRTEGKVRRSKKYEKKELSSVFSLNK